MKKCSCGAYISVYKWFEIQRLLITMHFKGTNRQHSSQMSQNTKNDENDENTALPIEICG